VNAERVEALIAELDRGEVRVAEPGDGDWRVNPEVQEAILEFFRLRQMEPQEVGPLDRGEIRIAERSGDDWVVNEEAKAAILDYFRERRMEPIELGPFEYHDKIPLKHDYERLGVRVVPPAVARYGSFLSPGVVMMPSYVNIGAWVGPRTMVDTWATVGSGAQIGADVHLAGGVGIGGVLEPPGARPVIVEDGAFVGSRAILTEGVRIGAGAVIGPNVSLTSSVPVIDVTGDEPVEHRGYVPPRSVVVPGTRPKDFPAGTYQIGCALIIGKRSESTDSKLSLNETLREFGIGAA
jgi:2,3,4,5-tetrahydropyridine-2-carboxylate N-succinyltransferase